MDLQGIYSLEGKSLGKGAFGNVQLAIELKTDNINLNNNIIR